MYIKIMCIMQLVWVYLQRFGTLVLVLISIKAMSFHKRISLAMLRIVQAWNV
jgi:hypothetical protein